MSGPSHSLRSPLGRARGLGSAKEGLHHWWMQRLTSLALIPLAMWFVVSLIGLRQSDWEQYTLWISNPINATVMILFLGVTFHHAQSGMQVVLEDYVSSHGTRIASIVAVKFICYALAALSIVSVLIVAFGV
ncbi:MAG: succinate dehydrogenase, hydrophobic membrane anchor protein [Rhodospirillaceae bacterium]|nr:succinate dehydrogenase, hydrophobic membrane anchor protein [Rhodospirillaceae bacterium]